MDPIFIYFNRYLNTIIYRLKFHEFVVEQI